MKFKIHFEVPGSDQEDSIIVEGESIDDVREVAIQEMEKRGADCDECSCEELD